MTYISKATLLIELLLIPNRYYRNTTSTATACGEKQHRRTGCTGHRQTDRQTGGRTVSRFVWRFVFSLNTGCFPRKHSLRAKNAFSRSAEKRFLLQFHPFASTVEILSKRNHSRQAIGIDRYFPYLTLRRP